MFYTEVINADVNRSIDIKITLQSYNWQRGRQTWKMVIKERNNVYLLFCRVVIFIVGFALSALQWGDWKNWQKYYPTVLFIMVVNLVASLLTYHHGLWNYSPDALFKSQTALELINCFVVLPAVAFLYLSKFPSNNKMHQYGYIAIWVLAFSGIEYFDHYIMKGIYYSHGWSWSKSTIFDCAIFSILRIHYLKPLIAWLITLVLSIVILIIFDFSSAEMK